MIYKCPVCAFAQMPYPPADYNICPCCGTEFGIDDDFASYLELRDDWLRRGGKWFGETKPYTRPAFWNAWNQLESAGFPYNVPSPQSSTIDYIPIDIPVDLLIEAERQEIIWNRAA
jgi:hypothetical protein